MRRALPAAWLLFLLLGCGGDFLSPRRHVPGAADARTPAPALATSWFSSTRIDVSWTDNVPNETGWEVWRSTTGATGTFTVLASLAANITSYSDVGLTPGTEYCYKVRWFRKTGPGAAYGDFLNVSCTTTPTPPPPPTNVNASFGDNSWVSVAWASPTSAVSSLRVERSGTVAGPWTTLLILTDAAATSYTDFNVTIEQLYCYRVSSISIGGEAPSSADCTVKPNAPTNIAAVPSDAQSVDVSWTDNSQFESEYEIQRSIDGWSVQATTTVSANVTSYHDGALTSNIRYYYRVRAKTTDAASSYSPWATAMPVSGPPGTPTVDYAYPYCSTCAAAYGSVAGGTESIRVERSAGGGGWVVAGTQPASNGWYFSESGLVTEQAVCYRAVAINSAGASSPSNERCTTPPAAPSDVSVVWLETGDAEVHWTNHSAVNDGYIVATYYYDYSGEYCYWGCQVEQDFLVFDRTATQTVVPGWLTPWYVCATKDGGCSDAVEISTAGAIASTATVLRLNTVTPALRTKLPKPLRDLVERGRPHLRTP
jgi:hypothetical protein